MRNWPVALAAACWIAAFAAFGGWVANIVKFVGLLGDPISTMFVARAVGIFFAPLGAVLGFL